MVSTLQCSGLLVSERLGDVEITSNKVPKGSNSLFVQFKTIALLQWCCTKYQRVANTKYKKPSGALGTFCTDHAEPDLRLAPLGKPEGCRIEALLGSLSKPKLVIASA